MTFDTYALAEIAVALVLASGVAGILAGLFGIGGGAIFVPVLYQTFGMFGTDPDIAMQLAIGSSLAIVIPTSVRSLMSHAKRGMVDFRLLRQWMIAVPLGAVLGALVAASVSSEALRAIFATIALVIATRLIIGRLPFVLGSDLPGLVGRSVAGVSIGTISSLMGIGGGVLNNTFMTLYGRQIHQAVATSAGVGVLVSIPGLLAYIAAGWGDPRLPALSIGFVNLLAIAVVAPLATLIAPVGASLAYRLTKRQLEIGFGLFLILIAMRFFASLL